MGGIDKRLVSYLNYCLFLFKDHIALYFSEKPMGQFSYDSIKMHPEETVIVSDTVAYDFGTSSVYYTDENGDPVELTDTYLVILKKDNDGVWKLHREVASSVVE